MWNKISRRRLYGNQDTKRQRISWNLQHLKEKENQKRKKGDAVGLWIIFLCFHSLYLGPSSFSFHISIARPQDRESESIHSRSSSFLSFSLFLVFSSFSKMIERILTKDWMDERKGIWSLLSTFLCLTFSCILIIHSELPHGRERRRLLDNELMLANKPIHSTFVSFLVWQAEHNSDA